MHDKRVTSPSTKKKSIPSGVKSAGKVVLGGGGGLTLVMLMIAWLRDDTAQAYKKDDAIREHAAIRKEVSAVESRREKAVQSQLQYINQNLDRIFDKLDAIEKK